MLAVSASWDVGWMTGKTIPNSAQLHVMYLDAWNIDAACGRCQCNVEKLQRDVQELRKDVWQAGQGDARGERMAGKHSVTTSPIFTVFHFDCLLGWKNTESSYSFFLLSIMLINVKCFRKKIVQARRLRAQLKSLPSQPTTLYALISYCYSTPQFVLPFNMLIFCNISIALHNIMLILTTTPIMYIELSVHHLREDSRTVRHAPWRTIRGVQARQKDLGSLLYGRRGQEHFTVAKA